VDLVEVDVVDAEPVEARVRLVDDVLPREPAPVGSIAHLAVDLRRDDELVAVVGGDRLADDLLGFAAGVDVGGVEEVDARVQRLADEVDALLAVADHPVLAAAEVHAAETEPGHFEAGGAEGRVLHTGR